MAQYTDPNEIVAGPVEVKIGGKEYHFKRWTWEVNGWIQKKFDRQPMELLQTMNEYEMGQLMYYMLEEKHAFPGVNVSEYDDDGRRVERWKPGFEVLMHAIKDPGELKQITTMLFVAFGAAQPKVEEIMDAAEKTLEKKPKPRSRKTGA